MPVGGTNPYLGDGFYDAPTQYGGIGITLAPGKKIRTTVRMQHERG